MAAKKKSAAKKKPAAKKKASTKKSAAKKAPSKKAPSKKAAAKKAPAKKAAAKKQAKSDSKPVEKKAEKKAEPTKKKGFSSLDVNMGHIFTLRPRLPTSFRPGDFQQARHLLEDESFKDATEAARAVAEKALELTHDGVIPGRGRNKRRF